MRTNRWLVAVPAAFSLVAAGCSGKTSSGGIQVRVNLQPGLVSTCVRVEVTPAGGGTPAESGPIQLAGKSSPLVVGVSPSGQAEPVTVQAIGYSDADCNQRTVPAEVSDTASGRFADPVTVLTVTLAPASTDGGMDAGTDGGVDMDNDGFSPPEDCDDTNPNIKPGVMELCVDDVDNNCDNKTDCEDTTTCGAQMCAVGGGAVCVAIACTETNCGDGADNDRDLLTDCADLMDCGGKACGTGGTCTSGACAAPTETGLCGDGLDNDNDTLVDCLDPDCPMGTSCSDMNACTMSDVCGSDGGCVPGADVTCNMPPNTQCYEAMGLCRPGTGMCDYTPNVDAGCDDGLGCTVTDRCGPTGVCAGTMKACDMPPGVCFVATGTCQEPAGTCSYEPLPAGMGSCSDGDNCTINDRCAGDGGCAGTPVTCTPPDQCLTKSGCDADGGCVFVVAAGQACDAGPGAAGSCSDAGTCVVAPSNVFPFAPSNFTEAQLPATSGALTFDCGTTTIDTGSMTTAVSWMNNCAGNPASPPYAEVAVGSQVAVLLFADSLTISGTLRAVGSRPLIIAVRNDATISGTLDVGSTPTSAGAGSGVACANAAGTNGNAGTSGGRSIGGGGGGGAFGSAGNQGGQGFGGTNGGSGGSEIGGPTLIPLRGGCPGGNGGRSSGADGRGGPGGGAVQLTVGGTLQVTATGLVSARGGGGTGGVSSGGSGIGGGGGGSGGGILLEGASVRVDAMGAVTANGGGGGQGGGIDTTGANGANGRVNSGNVAPGGADTNSCGGFGGSGAAGTALLTGATAGLGETCQNNGGSGGGGGGGVGRILLKASTTCTIDGVVSPPAKGNGPTNGCPAP
ncbi:MAG: putative metal-binding motif-containing protein [Myxococcota bacterium]|jgi:hypothetical protein